MNGLESGPPEDLGESSQWSSPDCQDECGEAEDLSLVSEGEEVRITVGPDQAGQRLDQFLAQQLPQFSRVHLRRVINTGAVRLGTAAERGAKPSHKVRAGEQITARLARPQRELPQAEDIPLSILYEDPWLIVVNKSAGMVVHPARGHWSGTLTAALQFHFEQLSSVGGPSRPGIVHRLDRDTSGVIVVAKDDRTHLKLAEQFHERTLEKEYLAIVAGTLERDRDWIDVPIGHHPYQREKMAIRRDHPTSKPAQTFFEVTERFRGFSLLRVLPKTGRTHQIRVHLEHIGTPVLCDRLYSGRSRITRQQLSASATDSTTLESRTTPGAILQRQALHARRLVIDHPQTGEPLVLEAPIPEDLQEVLAVLRTTIRGAR